MSNLKSKQVRGFKVWYRNEKELDEIYKEKFINSEYKFKSLTNSPFIIDCGSHIGLSILYFKSIYPDSEIIGFEPNPENFEILNRNIKENKLTNIKTYNMALSDKVGEIDLHMSLKKDNPWTWGDTIIYNMWGDGNDDRKTKVKTVKLSSYINRNIDLLKIDIEGSEQIVLQEIENKLHFVREIAMEFHDTKTTLKVNNFGTVKNILERNGFKIRIISKDLRNIIPKFIRNIVGIPCMSTIHAIKKDVMV